MLATILGVVRDIQAGLVDVLFLLSFVLVPT